MIAHANQYNPHSQFYIIIAFLENNDLTILLKYTVERLECFKLNDSPVCMNMDLPYAICLQHYSLYSVLPKFLEQYIQAITKT